MIKCRKINKRQYGQLSGYGLEKALMNEVPEGYPCSAQYKKCSILQYRIQNEMLQCKLAQNGESSLRPAMPSPQSKISVT